MNFFHSSSETSFRRRLVVSFTHLNEKIPISCMKSMHGTASLFVLKFWNDQH